MYVFCLFLVWNGLSDRELIVKGTTPINSLLFLFYTPVAWQVWAKPVTILPFR